MTDVTLGLKDSLIRPGSRVSVNGAIGSSKSLILARLVRELKKPLVVLTSDLKESHRFLTDLLFFLPSKVEVCLLPPLDVFPYFRLSPQPDLLMERTRILFKTAQARENFVVIAPLRAISRRIIPRKFFLEKTQTLACGDLIDRDLLIHQLAGLAYQRVPLVEDAGTFSVRGNLIDLYSPADPHPARIELMGDTIESIRFFDPHTQKTIQQTLTTQVIPAREILFDALPKDWSAQLKKRADLLEIPKSQRDEVAEYLSRHIFFNGIESFIELFYPTPASFFDFLPDQTVICMNEPQRFFGKLAEDDEEQRSNWKKATSFERLMPPESLFLTAEEIREGLSYYPLLELDDVETNNDDINLSMQSNALIQQKIKAHITSEQALTPLVSELNQKRMEGNHLFLVAGSPAQRERLKDLLSRYQLPLESSEEPLHTHQKIERAVLGESPSPFVQIIPGPLAEGFFWGDQKQWWITDEEIFGQKSKRISRQAETEVFSSFAELTEGDFIVHLDHGVGLYRGLKNLKFGQFQNDFLLLEYLGGDKLYVPVDKLNRVCRYSAQEGIHPHLDKLGGTAWQKTREKVKKATRRLARELLELQAIRESQKGFAFSPPDPLFEEFEATFPFEETDDQLRAIEEVVRDMQKEKPMDRLVCGDVGYGKTEVAMRAAFKAVADQKQAAILVPTTVLAFQHYETFKKRFAQHPVNIEMLSRFKTDSEQKKIIDDLKKGSIDIIIATHRLFSKDVVMKDLGLLVIDEEHRFGVAQKEKIKKLKSLVDVLTLSATPIPRTLNFSLVGIRDLSLINTPPADRLSIRTFVTSFDETTICQAVNHEINRGGQVYFVHNRVQSILAMKERLQKILPAVKMEVAHGQIDEEKLEEVMIGFMEKRFEVLLCTSIIESGLDIPNANTIIINRADHMGLSQLYQLRGRVGRSNHRAYCYLIIPPPDLVTDQARRRLQVIQKFVELGSGFKIASQDLEIRGAGNILGPEQSGHIAAMGYDLYVSLLKQAVHELKGAQGEEEIDPELKLDVSASIPVDLVPDAALRLVLYKQASSLSNEEEVDSLKDEWIDRLGKLPPSVENLLDMIRIKCLARKLKIPLISHKDNMLIFTIHPATPIPTDYFIQRIQKEPKKCQLLPEGKFAIRENKMEGKTMLEKIIGELRGFKNQVPCDRTTNYS